uniref:Elongator complex protein 6 n=1 Tax=Varanus komodoensis TaxID=61221 RepID=A0A8D2JE34_VARKO
METRLQQDCSGTPSSWKSRSRCPWHNPGWILSPLFSQGSSLTAAKERGQLVLLEGLKSANDFLFGQQSQSGEAHPFQFISGDGSDLKALYEFIRKALSPATDGDLWKFPVLMVDNLSVMLSLGVRPRDILDFIQYCRATVSAQLKGNLVVMVQSDDSSEDEQNDLLAKSLHHQSSWVLRAEGLASGFCKDVHGQLTIVQRSSWETKAERDLLRIFQYKIQDKNVAFFARGMSAAVL